MFTDDDLKRLKDKGAHWFYEQRHEKFEALIARLEATETIARLVQRYTERQGDSNDCRCDFCYALGIWRKSKGVK